MNFAAPIQAFFEADRTGDGEALAGTFIPDAVVQDEGRTHAGRAAILGWWRDARIRVPHVVEPLGDAEPSGAATTVRALVTGAFPGSPVVLRYAFRLDGDHIVSLEIAP